MFCRKCGASMPEDSNFCPECGRQTKRKSRRRKVFIVTILIAFFVGVFTVSGLHFFKEKHNEQVAVVQEESQKAKKLIETNPSEAIVNESNFDKKNTSEETEEVKEVKETEEVEEVSDAEGIEEVEKANSESVVSIIQQAQQKVFTIYSDFGQGSGFLINEFGDVLTNAHVIDRSVSVYLEDSTGKEFSGYVIGFSNQADVALVRVDELAGKEPLALETILKSQLGTEVIALGSPRGYENTATFGNISGVNRSFVIEPHTYDGVYQISAPIASGSSGGPLLDKQTGKAIAINSARDSQEATIGFSIPLFKVFGTVTDWVKNPMSEKEIIDLFYNGYYYKDYYENEYRHDNGTDSPTEEENYSEYENEEDGLEEECEADSEEKPKEESEEEIPEDHSNPNETETEETEQETSDTEATLQLQTYENHRFDFTVTFPASWPIGQEPANGDGIAIYQSANDNISVFGTHYDSEMSDANFAGHSEMTLDNGEIAYYNQVDADGKVMLELVYVKDAVKYMITGEVTAEFYSGNKNAITQMLKSLEVATEPLS